MSFFSFSFQTDDDDGDDDDNDDDEDDDDNDDDDDDDDDVTAANSFCGTFWPSAPPAFHRALGLSSLTSSPASVDPLNS